jgi:hypothetical protein
MLAGGSLALDHADISLKMRKNGRGFEENSQLSGHSGMIPLVMKSWIDLSTFIKNLVFLSIGTIHFF